MMKGEDNLEKESFKSLQLPEFLLDKLTEQKITQPTAVQEQSIPLILQGKDLIGRSPTGTGKTLAYLLPLLAKIDTNKKNLQALILAPTRELAMQVYRVLNQLTPENLLTVPLIGGANIERQIDSLKKKPQIGVGTPGRIVELIKKKKIIGQTIGTIVVDEGDKMLSLGYDKDLQEIIKTTSKDRQVLFFSATMPAQIVSLAWELMQEPATINIEEQVPKNIKHVYFMAEEKLKSERLRKLVSIYKPKKAIVFINHNEGVGPLVKRFEELGMKTLGLHSGLSQLARKNILEDFRQGKSLLLITTDIFARGMDISGVDFVFNFDLPENPQYYLHRVGRTGRAGQPGTAVTFVTEKQKLVLKKYERMLKIQIQQWGVSDSKVIPVTEPKKKTTDEKKKLIGKINKQNLLKK